MLLPVYVAVEANLPPPSPTPPPAVFSGVRHVYLIPDDKTFGIVFRCYVLLER